jgi:hypothetical protein
MGNSYANLKEEALIDREKKLETQMAQMRECFDKFKLTP